MWWCTGGLEPQLRHSPVSHCLPGPVPGYWLSHPLVPWALPGLILPALVSQLLWCPAHFGEACILLLPFTPGGGPGTAGSVWVECTFLAAPSVLSWQYLGTLDGCFDRYISTWQSQYLRVTHLPWVGAEDPWDGEIDFPIPSQDIGHGSSHLQEVELSTWWIICMALGICEDLHLPCEYPLAWRIMTLNRKLKALWQVDREREKERNKERGTKTIKKEKDLIV